MIKVRIYGFIHRLNPAVPTELVQPLLGLIELVLMRTLDVTTVEAEFKDLSVPQSANYLISVNDRITALKESLAAAPAESSSTFVSDDYVKWWFQTYETSLLDFINVLFNVPALLFSRMKFSLEPVATPPSTVLKLEPPHPAPAPVALIEAERPSPTMPSPTAAAAAAVDVTAKDDQTEVDMDLDDELALIEPIPLPALPKLQLSQETLTKIEALASPATSPPTSPRSGYNSSPEDHGPQEGEKDPTKSAVQPTEAEQAPHPPQPQQDQGQSSSSVAETKPDPPTVIEHRRHTDDAGQSRDHRRHNERNDRERRRIPPELATYVEVIPKYLKALKVDGILQHSLRKKNETDSYAFERSEFFGDSVLDYYVSKTLFSTRRFANGKLLSNIACAVNANANLCEVFDILRLDKLVDLEDDAPAFSMKGKADVVEAILGELDRRQSEQTRTEDQAVILESTRDMLVSFIIYVGERHLYSSHIFKRSRARHTAIAGDNNTRQQHRRASENGNTDDRRDNDDDDNNNNSNNNRWAVDDNDEDEDADADATAHDSKRRKIDEVRYEPLKEYQVGGVIEGPRGRALMPETLDPSLEAIYDLAKPENWPADQPYRFTREPPFPPNPRIDGLSHRQLKTLHRAAIKASRGAMFAGHITHQHEYRPLKFLDKIMHNWQAENKIDEFITNQLQKEKEKKEKEKRLRESLKEKEAHPPPIQLAKPALPAPSSSTPAPVRSQARSTSRAGPAAPLPAPSVATNQHGPPFTAQNYPFGDYQLYQAMLPVSPQQQPLQHQYQHQQQPHHPSNHSQDFSSFRPSPTFWNARNNSYYNN